MSFLVPTYGKYPGDDHSQDKRQAVVLVIYFLWLLPWSQVVKYLYLIRIKKILGRGGCHIGSVAKLNRTSGFVHKNVGDGDKLITAMLAM